MEPVTDQVVHYVNPAYLTDADVLNPLHVQSLIYFNGKQGPILIGAMFIMPRSFEAGPQVGGPLTVWHQHSNICFDDVTGMAVPSGDEPEWQASHKRRARAHRSTADPPAR